MEDPTPIWLNDASLHAMEALSQPNMPRGGMETSVVTPPPCDRASVSTGKASTDAESSSDSTSSPSKAAKPMKNASRDRVKAETEELRVQVEALERQKHVLDEKKRSQLHITEKNELWAVIAHMQRDQRVKAEEENRWLKEALDQQLRIGRHMQHAAMQSGAKSNPYTTQSIRDLLVTPWSWTEDTKNVVRAYVVNEIDEYFSQVDSVFWWVTQGDQFERSVVGVARDNTGVEHSYVEARDSRWIPFEFSQVSRALWEVLLIQLRPEHKFFEWDCVGPDHVVLRFKSLTRKRELDGLTVATIMIRKFMENNRLVIVWKCLCTATEDQVSILDRAFGETNGWVSVERARENATESSRISICSKHYPLWKSNPGGTIKLRMEHFPDLVLSPMQEDIATIVEAIEGRLLDDALALR
ncbi:hypothetical protein Poli38472_004980 [Pythium oligandrum]|uniref:Uncharacterized protein n=1 Tax=Pythium oligandrum TaxID=41045 RepID=A0A8K1FEX2_PYTOL|nr:hypothetical protein Poli38472_004980 [Pythium oligandrum]|eukprot:TMW59911.1 hypothetical protein Poli38472_004980 [Pythium oligandrum]